MVSRGSCGKDTFSGSWQSVLVVMNLVSTTEVARVMLNLVSSLARPKILEASQYPVLHSFLPKIVVSMITMDSNIIAFHFYYTFLKSNHLVLSYSNGIKCMTQMKKMRLNLKESSLYTTEFVKYRPYRENSAKWYIFIILNAHGNSLWLLLLLSFHWYGKRLRKVKSFLPKSHS